MLTFRELKRVIAGLKDSELDNPVICYSRFWPEEEKESRIYLDEETHIPYIYVVVHKEREVWNAVVEAAHNLDKALAGGRVFLDTEKCQLLLHKNGEVSDIFVSVFGKSVYTRRDHINTLVEECKRQDQYRIPGLRRIVLQETTVPWILEAVRDKNDTHISAG